MNFSKKVLKNGLTVITVPMKDNPTATVLVLVKTGSKYETRDINGISHFLEHMCFKGTTTRTGREIMRELDGLGAETNAFTHYEFTGYYTKGNPKHLKKMVDLVSDIYLNPKFPPEELEKEKGVIIGEIDMYQDLPRQVAAQAFFSLLYGDTPAGWPILGPKKNIQKFTRQDFINYRKKHYLPKATTILISGDVRESQVLKLISDKFSQMPSGKKSGKKKVIESQKSPAVKIAEKKSDQTHLILGVRTHGIFNKDIHTLELLSAVLGQGMSSRLFEKLREDLGLGYYVKSDHDAFTDHGFLVAVAGVSNKRVHEGIKAILGEMRRLRDEKVTEAELNKAKEYFIGRMYMGLESSNDGAEWYGVEQVLGLSLTTPAQKERKIRAISASDLLRVARKVFKNDRLNLALAGPYKNGKSFKKILKF